MKYSSFTRKGFALIPLIIVGALLIAGGIFLGTKLSEKNTQPQSLGSAQPIQAQKTFLSGSGIGPSNTTINLTSFLLSDGITPITTANLGGGVGYATIDPGVPRKEEDISFTGITQNVNGTAVLTGVSRGLLPVYPYTASTTWAYSHSGGATLVLSNSAAFYFNQFTFYANSTTVTGPWTFASSSLPKLSGDTTNLQIQANGFNLVDYNLLASTSFSGVGTANPISGIAGIGMFATLTQTAQGTPTSSYLGNTYYLFPWNSYFNATSSATTTVPVTGSNGKLSSGFIATSSDYRWTGSTTLQGSTTISGNLTISGTTNVTSNSFTFVNLPTVPTSTPTSTNMVASVNYVNLHAPKYLFNATTSSGGFAAGAGTSTPIFYGTSSISLASSGRVLITLNSIVSNSTQYDSCLADLYVNGVEQGTVNPGLAWMTSPNMNDAMSLSYVYITNVLSSGTSTFAATLQPSQGGTCSGTLNQFTGEYIGN